MEDFVKDQSSSPANSTRSSSKLRYPLRSATKSKEGKLPVAESSYSSAPKRERPASSVRASMGVLDLSGKDKSSKPPRRLSITCKSTVGPDSRPVGSGTPIYETIAKRFVNSQGKSDTPVSDASKLSNRKKFNVLSSASYWLSQIKLSEAAAKHSISLGFFKLALDAGCEPLQRMRDELKSYARQYNFVELGEPAKELFESYNILENFEQLQVSETCSQVPEEGTRTSDDDAQTGTRKLEPKSLNTDVVQVSSVIESTKKEIPKKNNSGMRTGGSFEKKSATLRSVSETSESSVPKKSLKSSKQQSIIENDKIKKQGKKSVCGEGPANPFPAEEAHQESKENMDDPQMEEVI